MFTAQMGDVLSSLLPRKIPRAELKEGLGELIVAYCNLDYRDVRRLGLVPAYDSVFDKIASSMEIYVTGRIGNLDELDDVEDEILRPSSAELRSHHKQFRAALVWLCSPKDPEPEVNSHELTNLFKSGKLEWGRYPMISERDEKFTRYFERHGLGHLKIRASLQGNLLLFPQYRHLVDILCAFVLSECAGKNLFEFPIRLCQRGDCRRFFLGKRKTRRFCSAKCRVKAHWTPERWRDYIRKYRLKKLPSGPRRRLQKLRMTRASQRKRARVTTKKRGSL